MKNYHKPYSGLAKYYDQYVLNNIEYFSHWADFIIEAYFEIHHSLPLTMLDIACGTGFMSRSIYSRIPSLSIDAFDLNPEMLEIAQKKDNARPIINYFQADMTEFELPNRYDLAICIFDSVNYLLTIKDFRKMLVNVERVLNTGGVFIFDISTVLNCRENFNEVVNIDESETHFIAHEAFYEESEALQRTIYTIFTLGDTGYVKSKEEHLQKIWQCKEIVEIIEQSHWTLYGIYDLESQKKLSIELPHGRFTLSKTKLSAQLTLFDESYERILFVLKKNGKK